MATPSLAVPRPSAYNVDPRVRNSGHRNPPHAPGGARETTSDAVQPGFRFVVVQGLLTNFHLPKSSLLLLVSALISRRRLLALYEEAIATGYRFYSYGDAMWIAPEAVLPSARAAISE